MRAGGDRAAEHLVGRGEARACREADVFARAASIVQEQGDILVGQPKDLPPRSDSSGAVGRVERTGAMAGTAPKKTSRGDAKDAVRAEQVRPRSPWLSNRSVSTSSSLDPIAEAKDDAGKGAWDWFAGADREFGADAEQAGRRRRGRSDRLPAPCARAEGVEVGAVEQSYAPEESGYALSIDGVKHVMERGRVRSFLDLATTRTAELVNGWLAKAGSQERLHLLSGGEDGVFVLLTPSMHEAIARSGLFAPQEIPAPI